MRSMDSWLLIWDLEWGSVRSWIVGKPYILLCWWRMGSNWKSVIVDFQTCVQLNALPLRILSPRILDWGEVTQQPKPWPFPLGLTLVPVSLSPVSLLREWALTCRYSWHSSFLFDSIASWWEALRKDSHWNYAILFLRRPLLSTLRLRI